jgi:hypothetical protein
VYEFVGRGIFSCGIFGVFFKCDVLVTYAFEEETNLVSFGKETDLVIMGGEKSDS